MVHGLSDPTATTITCPALKTHASPSPFLLNLTAPQVTLMHTELEASFAGKKGGGSGNNQKGTAPHISELSAQTLLRLTDSLHTFTSPSVPAGITPNHSRTLACYRNPEHSVEAPLLSASKDKMKSMLFNGFSYLESWSSGNSTHDYKDENQPERYPMCEK